LILDFLEIPESPAKLVGTSQISV